MKKQIKSLGLTAAFTIFGLGIAACTLDAAVNELNQKISQVLSKYQNKATSANLEFSRVEVDAKRAIALALSANYKKTGTKNALEIHVNNLSYDYNDGTSPTTNVDASVGIDLTQLLPQQLLKEIIPSVDQVVQDLVKQYAGEYGDAAMVQVKILEKNTDADGNYVSLKAAVTAQIDMSKLPADTKPEDVLFTQLDLQVAVDLKTGLSLQAKILSNPKYYGFRNDQQGLKELLEKLHNSDPVILQQIDDLYKDVDSFAGGIVDYSPEKDNQ